jgi:hypothetical protein
MRRGDATGGAGGGGEMIGNPFAPVGGGVDPGDPAGARIG